MSNRAAQLVRRASPGAVAALLAAAAYSWWAAGTQPFTVGGDVATAIPLGALAAVAIAQWRAEHRGRPPARVLRRLDRPPAATGAAWPLPAVLTGLLGWELYNFLSAPRTRYPTVSSLYDAAAAHHAWKAAFFLAWLALGWELVRR